MLHTNDAHANAEEICRLCDAFAAQNLALRDSFLFCSAAYLCTEIKTRSQGTQTVDFCTRYARKTAKICLPFAFGMPIAALEY